MEIIYEGLRRQRMTTHEDVLEMRHRLNGDGNTNSCWRRAVVEVKMGVDFERAVALRNREFLPRLGDFDGAMGYLDTKDGGVRLNPRVEGVPVW